MTGPVVPTARKRAGAATDPTDPAERVWTTMTALVVELNDRKGEVAAALGMSFVRVKALRRLARTPMSMRQLAAALGTDAAYATVVVDDLTARGLVERREDAADRRRKIVAATSAGRQAARRAEKVLRTPPAELTSLPAGDLADLDRILAAVVAARPSARHDVAGPDVDQATRPAADR
jgi:DNA-binding MarR family transcriptional regulator